MPAKPTNLRVSSSAERLQIIVIWNTPQVTVSGITDTSTLNYYISYKNLENRATRQVESSTERAVLNLKANTMYEIKVKSCKVFNTSVAGSWSDSLTIKTNESGKSCSHNHWSVLETIYFLPPRSRPRLLIMCEDLGNIGFQSSTNKGATSRLVFWVILTIDKITFKLKETWK